MAEGDAFWIPAVFSADANLKTGPGLPPTLDPDVDQFPNPVRVDARKGFSLRILRWMYSIKNPASAS